MNGTLVTRTRKTENGVWARDRRLPLAGDAALVLAAALVTAAPGTGTSWLAAGQKRKA